MNLKRQYEEIKGDVNSAITAVFDRSQFILGEEGQNFEREFSSYIGMPYGVGLNSGTDALHLALRAISIGNGDEVITVPNTATPTVSAIVQAGATPVFVDIDEKTYLMDTSKIESAITKKTKAIIPVHLYGNCVEMDKLMIIAKKHNFIVIEDCAQAHGAAYKGKKAGTFGDFSCFSFYPTKNLGAYGDAGIVLCKDENFYKKLIMLRQYGEDRRYNSIINGYNSRLDEIQAAILRIKLKFLDKWNKERKNIASRYLDGIKNPKVILPAITNNSDPVFHLFVVRVKNRDKLQKHLKSHRIGTATHYPVPLHLQPAYSRLGYKEGDFPVSEKIMNGIVSLPMFPELKDEEIEYVIEKINIYSD